MTNADRHALNHLLGRDDSMRATTDDLQGLLLQVVLALLMVFMIAYFLFVDRQKKERAEEVMDLNRQKLTLALEKTAENRRVRYGLNALMTQGTDGRRTFAPEDHVKGGQIVLSPAAQRAFSAGCAAAYADYGDPEALTAAWRRETLAEAGIRSEALSPDEVAWLDGELLRQVEGVKLDARGAQRAMASLLQRRWIERPETLGDITDVREIADELQQRSLRAVSEAAGSPMLP